MALDLFLGIRKRNWARDPAHLLTVPVPSVKMKDPVRETVRQAKEIDSKVKVRTAAGRGATVSTRFKWE